MVLCLPLSGAVNTFAQKRFAETYKAQQNVRLQLANRTGAITVESWDRNEIRVVAEMDAPIARLVPELSGDTLIINVVRDNHLRDVGDVNFRIHVPVNSNVDLETKRGNISVRGVQGSLVRARVTSEGDIELTGIRAATVIAKNLMGNIFFDGEILPNGTYELTSMQGDISVRIPDSSGFQLMATAPGTRSIDLGGFAKFFNPAPQDKRRITGNVGNGRASLTVISHRGPINFVGR